MNTQINEDYVSFETAKLLKEKGFDEICYLGYNKNGEYVPTSNRTNSQIIQPDFCFICCPTLQMAMKWLREVHEIFIEIPIYSIAKPVLYRWNAFKNGRLVTDEEKPKTSNCIIKGDDNNPIVYYYKYEESCEAAIKYCLENLI